MSKESMLQKKQAMIAKMK